jgi:hypothetical protein
VVIDFWKVNSKTKNSLEEFRARGFYNNLHWIGAPRLERNESNIDAINVEHRAWKVTTRHFREVTTRKSTNLDERLLYKCKIERIAYGTIGAFWPLHAAPFFFQRGDAGIWVHPGLENWWWARRWLCGMRRIKSRYQPFSSARLLDWQRDIHGVLEAEFL